MNLVVWLVVGGLMGVIGNLPTPAEGGRRVATNVLVGIAGALVGGWPSAHSSVVRRSIRLTSAEWRYWFLLRERPRSSRLPISLNGRQAIQA